MHLISLGSYMKFLCVLTKYLVPRAMVLNKEKWSRVQILFSSSYIEYSISSLKDVINGMIIDIETIKHFFFFNYICFTLNRVLYPLNRVLY